MSYACYLVDNLDEIEDLLRLALAEYDGLTRCKRAGFSPLQYFQHIDLRAARQRKLAVYYIAVRGIEDDLTPVGFARVVVEDALPGEQPLPGDPPVACIDEIFITPAFRGRGPYALLIERIRSLMIANHDCALVWARIVDRRFARKCESYGLRGLTQILSGPLSRLRLPDYEQKVATRDEASYEIEGYKREGQRAYSKRRSWREWGGAATADVVSARQQLKPDGPRQPRPAKNR